MIKTILIVALCIVAGAVGALHIPSNLRTQNMAALWQSWKLQNQKIYSPQEEPIRFGIFFDNVRKIAKLNNEYEGVKFGINLFADLTATEFKQKHASCGFQSNPAFVEANAVSPPPISALPTSVDWRTKGAVTGVKNQGACGSCWSFSATGAIEGHHFINNKTLLSFSEQQLMDCDTGRNVGCSGGFPYLAMEYAAEYGLELESGYPYVAREGSCKYNKSEATKANTGYSFLTPHDSTILKTALVSSPVSILVEANQDIFQFYKSGVISTGCGTSLDHAVLTVGYETVSGTEAFIVKNSWGPKWGLQGYLYISTSQTVNNGQGACGILNEPLIAK